MEKKELNGEYLAPQVKVVQMQARQQMLSVSPANVSDPWGGDEENW